MAGRKTERQQQRKSTRSTAAPKATEVIRQARAFVETSVRLDRDHTNAFDRTTYERLAAALPAQLKALEGAIALANLRAGAFSVDDVSTALREAGRRDVAELVEAALAVPRVPSAEVLDSWTELFTAISNVHSHAPARVRK